VARDAAQERRRELEKGFNGLADNRHERIRTIGDLAGDYLTEYRLRHKSDRFVTYSIANIKQHLGERMAVEVSDATVKDFQSARLNEKAAPKTINEDVGILLRLLGEQGGAIRARMRQQKALKLATRRGVGRAFALEETERLLAQAKGMRRSPVIYPAVMLALNAGLRDAEIRTLQWGRLELSAAMLTVGESKTEAGSGRTIPLNAVLLEALVEYAKWYTKRFGTAQSDWYVFPFGKPFPKNPKRPVASLKTAWKKVRTKANVQGRFHDCRHTFVTRVAESGEAGDETIRDLAGHVSRQMLKHYSHIGMEAKRRAVQALVTKRPTVMNNATDAATSEPGVASIADTSAKDSPKVEQVH
jgi:integrase